MNQKKISITINPEIAKFLENGHYNKSKLIDSLLFEYFKEKKKEKK